MPLLALFIALEKNPDFPINQQFDQQQLSSIENILIEYDPRYWFNSSSQFIELDEAESNALLLYFSQQINSNNSDWLTGSSMRVELEPGLAIAKGTLAIKPGFFGSYINYEANFAQENEAILLQSLRLGGILVPEFIIQPLYQYSQQILSENNNFLLFSSALNAIDQIDIQENYLGLNINWQSVDTDFVSEQARQFFIDQTTHDNLISYQNHLVSVLDMIPESSRTISLNVLLAPLFSYALENPGDPKEENRAIFLVLVSYLFDELSIEDLIGQQTLPATRALRVTLENRDDLPRHMIGSAAIAAYADNNLANMLSTYKEVQDSRRYSGFSFSDITANQIGTRLGELTNNNPTAALELQRFFANVQAETDYMPLVGRHDGISEAEFIAQYESRSSEAYLERMASIENTIDQLAIFQGL
jgi:hypothetical protein